MGLDGPWGAVQGGDVLSSVSLHLLVFGGGRVVEALSSFMVMMAAVDDDEAAEQACRSDSKVGIQEGKGPESPVLLGSVLLGCLPTIGPIVLHLPILCSHGPGQ